MFHRINSTRKPHPCYYCSETIPASSKCFLDKFLNNLVWQSEYVCVDCGVKKGAAPFV